MLLRRCRGPLTSRSSSRSAPARRGPFDADVPSPMSVQGVNSYAGRQWDDIAASTFFRVAPAGCAENSPCAQESDAALQQQQVALQQRNTELQARAADFDRNNQELQSLLAQTRQQTQDRRGSTGRRSRAAFDRDHAARASPRRETAHRKTDRSSRWLRSANAQRPDHRQQQPAEKPARR